VWCLLSDVVCTGQESNLAFWSIPDNERPFQKSWCCAHATSFMAVFVQDYSTSSKKPHRYRWSQIPVAAVSGTSYWFRSPILIGFLGRQNVCPQNPPSREEEEAEEEPLQQLARCRVTDNDLAMSQNYIEPPKLIAFINQIDLLKKIKGTTRGSVCWDLPLSGREPSYTVFAASRTITARVGLLVTRLHGESV
jgi:hypothetical protein